VSARNKGARAIDEKCRELQKSLEPTFHEDTANTIEMMIAVVWRKHSKHGGFEKEEDRQRFLAALARLPEGGCPNPLPFPLPNRLPPAFGLIFMEQSGEYHSSKRFDTEDAANEYAARFLRELRNVTRR